MSKPPFCFRWRVTLASNYRYCKPFSSIVRFQRFVISWSLPAPVPPPCSCIPRLLGTPVPSQRLTPTAPISNRSPTHLPLIVHIQKHLSSHTALFVPDGSPRLPPRLLRVRRERAAQLVAHLPNADRAHLRLLPVSLRASGYVSPAPQELCPFSLPTHTDLHPSFPRTPRAGLPSMHSVWSVVGALHLSLQAGAV